RADPGAADPLGRHATGAHPGVADRNEAAGQTAGDLDMLGELQDRLWAEGSRAALLILQGMDTSGKSGVIKHVGKALNPHGVNVKAFAAPSEEERAHDFLWRIRRAVPPFGQVGIFDRSHYEDVLVVRVRGLVPEEAWSGRYDIINRFEEELVALGTTVVKCLLHISYDYQRERLLARLEDPTKWWKFQEGDIEERRYWPAYQEAYADAVRRCSPAAAPWYVIPADRKWYRKWAVSRILVETLQEMKPEYPRTDVDVEALKARLAPPN
ncbi:MAG: polyphosphate kinase 2 family protein, partial [Actinomycetota bacterium]|nr:polyphosphate kinase 2 family protein [Actinomycetota bacterium]